MDGYRYENKYIIDTNTATLLKMQLGILMEKDSHSICDEYSYDIRSLYFDDPDATAYDEKTDGVEFRKKYRLRMYNGDTKSIKLECKYKDEQMTRKEDCHMTLTNAQNLLAGKYKQVKLTNSFWKQFVADAKAGPLKPAVIVDYRRLAYVYPYSDVRITFDSQLKSGSRSTDFFDTTLPTPEMFDEDTLVLEVKYNEYLPVHIRMILDGANLTRGALSKFALCDEYK